MYGFVTQLQELGPSWTKLQPDLPIAQTMLAIFCALTEMLLDHNEKQMDMGAVAGEADEECTLLMRCT